MACYIGTGSEPGFADVTCVYFRLRFDFLNPLAGVGLTGVGSYKLEKVCWAFACS